MDTRSIKLLLTKGAKFQKMCIEAKTSVESKEMIHSRLIFTFGRDMGDHFYRDFKHDLDANSFIWNLDQTNLQLFCTKF